ncbi:hypothetical protein AALP_AA8G367500 [Arabis alpina]|uniref:DUF4283 domain-containing protein n=1 Tax=Arabis alpina TaxID=50452 RepID=A0A087GBR8_ARAAL|nr:hypothetical protein AALP_AA8G367500 [Arabis alpina]
MRKKKPPSKPFKSLSPSGPVPPSASSAEVPVITHVEPPILESRPVLSGLTPLLDGSAALDPPFSSKVSEPHLRSVKADSPAVPDVEIHDVVTLAAYAAKEPQDTTVKAVPAAAPEEKNDSKTPGESCVKILNSVIEKNRKSWDFFIIGQFYSDPPSQGTIHNIVNGIWSRQYRDVTVSKMEGNAFLFRIPNAATRNGVLTQRLWQIEGQTMFVAKWEPGVIPVKPELSSAPIWLELRQVPFQFFNEDRLERIAGLVGDPKFLHTSTTNKTNLEVAKVFTVIDPCKPLPEAVNVQFESGDIARVLVSSPWMPPTCGFCKEVGHNLKRCKKAQILCSVCNSTTHEPDQCPKKGQTGQNKGASRRGRARSRSQVQKKSKESNEERTNLNEEPPSFVITPGPTSLGVSSDTFKGESSGLSLACKTSDKGNVQETGRSCKSSEVEEDSSDVESSPRQSVSGESYDHQGYTEVTYNIKKKGKKGKRGKGPKTT